jgi:hypothetical protein
MTIQLTRDGRVIRPATSTKTIQVAATPADVVNQTAPTLLSYTACVVDAKTGIVVEHYPPLHGSFAPNVNKSTYDALRYIKDRYPEDIAAYGWVTEEVANELISEIEFGVHLVQVQLTEATLH